MINVFLTDLLKWREENYRELPWREKKRSPYEILVAELLLQRTPTARVVAFYPKFLYQFPNPRILAATEVEELERILRPMGLRKKASWLTQLMQRIVETHEGKIPNNETSLIQLKGIGKYTARAVLTFAFNQDVAIVDVNVVRVIQRFFGFPEREKKPSEDKNIWSFVEKIIPYNEGKQFNETILDLSAMICKKRNPVCIECPLNKFCKYHRNK